jgi:transposase
MVKEIKRLYENGASSTEIAKYFEVTISNIYHIVSGRTWKHI